MTGEREVLYSCFNSQNFAVPVSGGLSAPNQHGQWVMLENDIYVDACVAAVIEARDLHVWVDGYSEWTPIGRTFTVTDCDNKRVYALEGQKILSVYDSYLGGNTSVTQSQIKHFPLIRGKKVGREIGVPQKIYPDGSIEFDIPLHSGDELRFCYNHPKLNIEQVKSDAQILNRHSPDTILIYNCTSRLAFMGGNEELLPLNAVASTCGTYCLGEFCYSDGQQDVRHHSMTYLAFREGDRNQPVEPLPFSSSHPEMTSLLSLVRNAINDVEEMQNQMARELREQTRKLTESYRIDSRTGLPNRVVLIENLNDLRLDEHLISMKINNLSQINEKYSYQIGDLLLKEVSRYALKGIRRYATQPEHTHVYSIGIGEWAITFRSDSDNGSIRQTLYDMIDRIEHVNFKPKGIADTDYLSVSVHGGYISKKDYPGLSAGEILLKSIEARRNASKHNHHICNSKDLEPIHKARKEQLGWLSLVNRGVLNNDVLVYGQPIVQSGTHEEVSKECLVRIQDGNRIITPGYFLPIIEGTHLYTRLSRQMISNTFKLMRTKTHAFSINLSPQDLMSDRTMQLLESELRACSHPERVGLEILETEQISNYAHLIDTCNHLRSLGAHIIVDDYGSGFSNLDKIVKLEPQIIKLDGSIIKNIDKDTKQRKITQTLVKLCNVMEAKTVGEFVHNQEVCQIAEDIGIDYLQGYYLGEPALIC